MRTRAKREPQPGLHLDGWDYLSPVERWGHARKAYLLDGIRRGQVKREAAMAAHNILAEEMDSWCRAYRAGVPLTVSSLVQGPQE